MLILHLSGLGCHRPSRHEEPKEPVDLVFYTGDAECIDIIEWLLSSYPRIVYVTGEREVPAARRRLQEAGVLADGRIIVVSGLGIAGVGGLGMKEDMGHLEGVTGVSVLLSHFPPYMGLDVDKLGIHRGIEAIAGLASQLGVRAVFYGHAGTPGCTMIDGIVHSNASKGWYSLVEWSTRGPSCLDTRRLLP